MNQMKTFDEFICSDYQDLNESRFLGKVVHSYLPGLLRNTETMPQGL